MKEAVKYRTPLSQKNKEGNMNKSADEAFRERMQQLSKEEKIIVLEALERHLFEREKILFPAQ